MLAALIIDCVVIVLKSQKPFKTVFSWGVSSAILRRRLGPPNPPRSNTDVTLHVPQQKQHVDDGGTASGRSRVPGGSNGAASGLCCT